MPRLYFTGRRKIPAKHVQLRILRGEPPRFDVNVDLSSVSKKLPANAAVVVEARDSFRLQRFDLGTVADCRPREDLLLDQFADHDNPSFRLRIVDRDGEHPVLLAACDSIRASHPDDGGDGGESLLPIMWKPNSVMQGELWLLNSCGSTGHELWLNRDSAMFKASMLGGELAPLVQGCVIPAAIRGVLRHELWRVECGGMSPEWRAFANELYSEPPPELRDDADEEEFANEIEDWIDRVVKQFCSQRGRFVSQLEALEQARGSA